MRWKKDGSGDNPPEREQEGEGEEGAKQDEGERVDVGEASNNYVAHTYKQVLCDDDQKPIFGNT